MSPTRQGADMTAMRWARAALLAAVCSVAGVVAHVGSHGRLPGPLTLVGLFLLLVVACRALLLQSRASSLRTVVLLVGGQTFFHAALAVTAGHGGSHHSDHVHGSALAAGAETRMVVAHLVAAAVTGAWLAYGEAALFRVVALTLATVRCLFAVPSLMVLRRPGLKMALVAPAGAFRCRLDGRVLPRRGPPSVLLTTV